MAKPFDNMRRNPKRAFNPKRTMKEWVDLSAKFKKRSAEQKLATAKMYQGRPAERSDPTSFKDNPVLAGRSKPFDVNQRVSQDSRDNPGLKRAQEARGSLAAKRMVALRSVFNKNISPMKSGTGNLKLGEPTQGKQSFPRSTLDEHMSWISTGPTPRFGPPNLGAKAEPGSKQMNALRSMFNKNISPMKSGAGSLKLGKPTQGRATLDEGVKRHSYSQPDATPDRLGRSSVLFGRGAPGHESRFPTQRKALDSVFMKNVRKERNVGGKLKAQSFGSHGGRQYQRDHLGRFA